MTFLNPFVLFGLIAASIPLVLHLLNLRRLRTIEFSSLRFLRELQHNTLRRVKIRQWLLLLVRTLLIASLVVAFSRPAIVGSWGSLAGGRATSTMVVLLDDSPSMTVRTHKGMLFNQAREVAGTVAALAKTGDLVYLLPLSQAVAAATPVPVRGGENALPLLDRLHPSLIRVSFQKGLEAALRILESSNTPNREIVLITDAQATQFSPDSISGSVKPEAAPRARVFLVRIPNPETKNTSVAMARVESRIVARNRPLEIAATIRNYAAVPAAGTIAGITFGGAHVAQQSVDVPAGGGQTIVARTTPRRSGFIEGSVDLEDDALLADNHRYFAAHIPGTLSVLLVGNSRDDVRFIRLGLTLGHDSTLAGLFAVREVAEGALPGMDLRGIDVAILCNLKDPGPAADNLARFVHDGGGLMIFPGPQSDVAAYNEGLFRKLGMPPMTFVNGATGTVPALSSPLEKVDKEHPIFTGMFEQRRGNIGGSLPSPRITSAVVPGETPASHQIILLSAGRPFMEEYSHHEGRILLMAVDAGGAWSDFPMQGLFVPLLDRSILYLSTHVQDVHFTTVGSPVECSVPLSELRGRMSYVVVSPSGIREKIVPEVREPAGTGVFRSSRTTETGVYEIRSVPLEGDGTADGTVLTAAAVNIDQGESDLRPADEPLFRAFWTRLGIKEQLTRIVDGGDPVAPAIEESRFGLELWKHFLVLALLLAVAEILISRLGATPTAQRQ